MNLLWDLLGCCYSHIFGYKKDPIDASEYVPLITPLEDTQTLSEQEIIELLNDQEYEDYRQKLTDTFFTILPNRSVIYTKNTEKIIEYF
jgi:hypothetical protein